MLPSFMACALFIDLTLLPVGTLFPGECLVHDRLFANKLVDSQISVDLLLEYSHSGGAHLVIYLNIILTSVIIIKECTNDFLLFIKMSEPYNKEK